MVIGKICYLETSDFCNSIIAIIFVGIAIFVQSYVFILVNRFM